jgi:SM-20-related protein
VHQYSGLCINEHRARDQGAIRQVTSQPIIHSQSPVIRLYDDVLEQQLLADVQDYLQNTSWKFGAVSYKAPGSYRYWYKHFAGGYDEADTSDCSGALLNEAPVIWKMWSLLEGTIFKDHTLMRCYANGYPYGCEGSAHLDSADPSDYTAVFYSNPTWDPNWSGETIFLTQQPPADIIAAILPRPNRLVLFQGNVPHAARGISRVCPLLRITLMFKTKKKFN